MSYLNTKGRFITIEGIEGVGKSTAIKFLDQKLTEMAIDHITTREPGGTKIAENIREILLNLQNETLTPETELLLMFACRAQNISEVILPALKKNQWVLCDRFTDASVAYQGGGRGIATSTIDQLSEWVQKDLIPDITFLLDAPLEIGFSRLEKYRKKDRIEKENRDFFERVREGYLLQAKRFPERIHVIDATKSLEKVQEEMLSVLFQ